MAKSFLNTTGLPLGLRNNNPGNLRPGIDWQGAIGQNQGFVVFENIAYGIRAMSTDIGNDMRLDGKNTIRKLISEYAPPSENDTDAYIASVVGYTGFSADQVLQPTKDTLMRLIRAILNVELGVNYSNMISQADLLEGLTMLNPQLLSYFGITGAQAAGDGIGVIITVLAIAYFIKR